jgi:hypothetical protein
VGVAHQPPVFSAAGGWINIDIEGTSPLTNPEEAV